jgi:hypothetical protein
MRDQPVDFRSKVDNIRCVYKGMAFSEIPTFTVKRKAIKMIHVLAILIRHHPTTSVFQMLRGNLIGALFANN